MVRVALLALLCVAIVGDAAATEAHAKAAYELRIATLAPSNSPVGRAYRQLNRELKKATQGQVSVKLYGGGAAGDEKTIVRKMRIGQLDGALVTATGLGWLVRQVLVLQAPGLITSYEELDRVRTRLAPELDKLFKDAGYTLVSWGDSGRIRIFGNTAIRRPSDLHSVRPWTWRDSPTMKAFVKATGANGVALGVPEVYPALQTGMVDTIIASSIAVLGFQWHTRLKTMSKRSSGVIVGAFVVRSDKFNALPKEGRDYILNTSRKVEDQFRNIGRKLDDDATRALAKRLKPIDMDPYLKSWEAAAKRAREALAGRLYPRSLMDRVEKIVSEP